MSWCDVDMRLLPASAERKDENSSGSLPRVQPLLEMLLMASPDVVPGTPRVHTARDTTGVCWQVAKARVLQEGLTDDGAAGAGGTSLCLLDDSALSSQWCRALPCPSWAAV